MLPSQYLFVGSLTLALSTSATMGQLQVENDSEFTQHVILFSFQRQTLAHSFHH